MAEEPVWPERRPWYATWFWRSLVLLALGLALGALGEVRAIVAGEDLRAGRLVRALPQEVAADSSYWFVCPEGAVDRPRVAAFRAWLLEEAARERGG
jgi:LysR family glycine cleavage system transcriptional activator